MKLDMERLGEEVICDALVRSQALNNSDLLYRLCLEALKFAECHVYEDAVMFRQFKEGTHGAFGDGVTGLIIIEESHFHISTWPEKNFVQININTCGHMAKPLIAVNYLLHELNVISSTLLRIERGVPI